MKNTKAVKLCEGSVLGSVSGLCWTVGRVVKYFKYVFEILGKYFVF